MFVSFLAFGDLLNLLKIVLIPDYVVLQAEQKNKKAISQKFCLRSALCSAFADQSRFLASGALDNPGDKAQKYRWKKMGWCLRCKHATPQTPEILTINY